MSKTNGLSAAAQRIQNVRDHLSPDTRVMGWRLRTDKVLRTFAHLSRDVLTFVGYSGMGYENEAEMLERAAQILANHDPKTTFVNIGVTAEGIGAVYPLARALGFQTTGIVSRVSLDYPGSISSDVNLIFIMGDKVWGGNLPGTHDLSPTSEAMVRCSTRVVAIGGNEISRDELTGAQRLGIPIEYYPAEINHANRIQRAAARGEPTPVDFSGAAAERFA